MERLAPPPTTQQLAQAGLAAMQADTDDLSARQDGMKALQGIAAQGGSDVERGCAGWLIPAWDRFHGALKRSQL